jgi:hypothetical protein
MNGGYTMKLLQITSAILLSAIITGCSSDDTQKQTSTNVEEQNITTNVTPPTETESKLDTSVFVYAKSVDVTDGREAMKHLDLVVNMDKSTAPGLATRHVLTQTYDFLQQSDISGADTITIGVMSGDLRVSQITVDVAKFKAGDNIIGSVLIASKIDKMTPEVKEFGKTMNLW